MMLVGEQPGDYEDVAGKPFRWTRWKDHGSSARRSWNRPIEGLCHERGETF